MRKELRDWCKKGSKDREPKCSHYSMKFAAREQQLAKQRTFLLCMVKCLKPCSLPGTFSTYTLPSFSMAVRSKQSGWSGFAPTTFSQTQLTHTYIESNITDTFFTQSYLRTAMLCQDLCHLQQLRSGCFSAGCHKAKHMKHCLSLANMSCLATICAAEAHTH